MSISNIVITLKDEVVNSLNPSKYPVLNGNFVFDLRDLFQERNPGIKRDLFVFSPYVGRNRIFGW
jgi:hypothetical protein